LKYNFIRYYSTWCRATKSDTYGTWNKNWTYWKSIPPLAWFIIVNKLPGWEGVDSLLSSTPHTSSRLLSASFYFLRLKGRVGKIYTWDSLWCHN